MNYDLTLEIKNKFKNASSEQIIRVRKLLEGIKVNPSTVKYDEDAKCLEAIGNEDIHFKFYESNEMINIYASRKNTAIEFVSKEDRFGINAQDETNGAIVINEKGAFLCGQNGSGRPYKEFYDLAAVDYIKSKASEMGTDFNILSAIQFKKIARELFIKPDWHATFAVPTQDVEWHKHLLEERDRIKNTLLDPSTLTDSIEKSMQEEEEKRRSLI